MFFILQPDGPTCDPTGLCYFISPGESLHRPAAAHKVSAEVDVSTVFRLSVRPLSAVPAAV